MYKLTRGQIIDNADLCAIFRCSNQGGMRRSYRTNTLTIISNHIVPTYYDKWIGDTFHYTGIGLEGNQSLDFMQNKTLHESNKNKINILLFEVFDNKEYTFIGKMKLADKPYEESQPDRNGKSRRVWMFPLKIIEEYYEYELIKE